jgi:Ca2+-binding RTX toxin-like protein
MLAVPHTADAVPEVDPPVGIQNGLLAVTSYYGVRLAWPTGGDPGFLMRLGEVAPSSVAWSPDGQMLAYVIRGVLEGRIVLSDRTGGGVVDVTPFDAKWETVSWTPEGRLLASRRSSGSMIGVTELWTMGADGSDPQLLLDGEAYGGRDATASPDGASLAFTRLTPSGHFELVRHGIASGEQTVLATDDEYLGAPDWSPDGQQIAYRTRDALRMISAVGGGPRTVVDESHLVRTLTWAPDGTRIAFKSHADPALHTVDAVNGDITTLPVPGVLIGEMDWQPLPACTVTGTGAGEELTGTPGDDVICSEGGDDVVAASAGQDVVLGGGGHDVVSYAGSPVPVDVDLWAVDGAGQGRTQLMSVEEVEGSPHDDRLWGSPYADTLQGGAGDDQLNGGPGSDVLDGGAGTDELRVEAAQLETDEVTSQVDVDLQVGTATSRAPTGDIDVLEGLEDVVLRLVGDARGDDGANRLVAPNGTVEGRGGDDDLVGQWVSYESAPGPVQVDLVEGAADGAAGFDVLGQFSGAIGSPHGDEFRADHQQVYAGAGDDVVVREGFGDVVAGAGDDRVNLSAMTEGVDVLAGGDDTLGWRPRGEVGSSWYLHDTEQFVLTPYGDYFFGSSRPERVDGGGGPDYIVAGPGDDVVAGGSGADRLVDGAGDDRLAGGPGDDVSLAAAGDDVYVGGRGTDLLEFTLSAIGVVVDLADSTASGLGADGVISTERVTGSAHGDVLLGNDGRNHLAGLAGDDLLRGRAGRDRIDGGPDRDRCSRGSGDRTLRCE